MTSEADYLKMIKRTYAPDTDRHVLFCMIGVAGEAGEIANLCQKGMRGDWNAEDMGLLKAKFDDATIERRQALLEECGGVLYFLTALAWRLGAPMEEVRRINAEKLLSRLERGTIRGDGDDR